MITIEQMQYILELSKTHSFHKTAENLYISQPAISKAIKKVEDELQLQLFDRCTTGVYPTKAGSHIIEIINDVIHRMNDLYVEASNLKYYQEESLLDYANIYCHNTLGNYVLPPLMTGLHNYLHGIDVHIIEGSREDSLKKILSDSCGIGMGIFTEDDIEQIQQDFQVIQVCTPEPYLASNSEKRPLDLENKTCITLDDLPNYPLVLNQFAPPLSEALIDNMKERGYNPKIVLKCPTASLFTKYITEGLACGIITKLGHSFMFPVKLENISYLPIEHNNTYAFLLYAHKDFPEQLFQLVYHLLRKQFLLI